MSTKQRAPRSGFRPRARGGASQPSVIFSDDNVVVTPTTVKAGEREFNVSSIEGVTVTSSRGQTIFLAALGVLMLLFGISSILLVKEVSWVTYVWYAIVVLWLAALVASVNTLVKRSFRYLITLRTKDGNKSLLWSRDEAYVQRVREAIQSVTGR